LGSLGRLKSLKNISKSLYILNMNNFTFFIMQSLKWQPIGSEWGTLSECVLKFRIIKHSGSSLRLALIKDRYVAAAFSKQINAWYIFSPKTEGLRLVHTQDTLENRETGERGRHKGKEKDRRAR
jgi:hypothetical protein